VLMKVTVIIPSCSSQRIPLLTGTIDSILASTYKDVYPVIIADGNEEIYKTIKDKYYMRLLGVFLNVDRKDWVYSINHALKSLKSDYYIYASDDLIFPPDCIENAVNVMQRDYPDGDGVVSIGRKNRCVFGLMGNKFINRFPDRQVFCPDYIHYCSDSELLGTVKRLGKLTYPPDRQCQVKHFRMKDETWRLARRARTRDREIHRERQEKGYQWGIDFNRVTGR